MDGAGQFDPAHFRHDYIADNHVHRMREQIFHRFPRSGKAGLDGEAQFIPGKKLSEAGTDFLLVIYNSNTVHT